MTDAPLVEAQSAPGAPVEGDFDWRYYLMVLASWWKEIVVITLAGALLAGVGVLAYGQLTGPQYKAWADVAIVRTVTELNFDERFTTTSSTDIRYIATNPTAYRNALLGLAQSPAIAEQVAGQLGDALDAELRVPAELAKDVEAALVSGSGRPGDSDLLRITATADTPDKAARIATTWAERYVREVNQTYGQTPEELLISVQTAQVEASANYERAQKAVEEFIAGDRRAGLTRQIAEKENVIDQITKARSAVAAGHLGAEAEIRTSHFERWLAVKSALEQARSLRDQVAAGSATSTGGAALVVELLKLQAFTQVLAPSSATSELRSEDPVQVQLDTPLQIQLSANSELSRGELLADIDALVDALERRRGELELQMGAEGQQLASAGTSASLDQAPGSSASAQPPADQANAGTEAVSATGLPTSIGAADLFDSTVLSLEGEIRGLRAELEVEEARHKQLVQERDLAWDTLKTVGNKVAELVLARTVGSSEVRLASPAVPPSEPEDAGAVKAVVLGGMVGLVIGVFIALIANSFGIPPISSRRQARA